jgi:8-oxo-dGTP pyrophosphatase MutT (NUDIX family)
MAHIHTEPGQYDHTVSIYLLRTDFDEPKMMLHFHKKIGAYAQFGGHIELNENPWEAVTHELREETGYDIDQISVLQPLQRMQRITGATVHPSPAVHATMGYPQSSPHLHTDSTYVLTADEPPRRAPDDGESTDIQLFTRTEVASHPDIDDITRDIALYAFDEIFTAWQPTPSITFQ